MLFSFCLILISLSNPHSEEVRDNFKFLELERFDQDNTILIRKLKIRIKALRAKKKRLQDIQKWTPKMEEVHKKKIDKYKKSLEKLGIKYTEPLDAGKIIKELQRQLKYLNNYKINEKSKENWSLEREKTHEQKASILIDSIIKLRIKRK